MPWRSNIGQPLHFRSSSVDSACEEASQEDDKTEQVESTMNPNSYELSFQEFLGKMRLGTEDDSFHDFDARDVHEDINSWNERFEDPLHEQGSMLGTTDYDSDFCYGGGVATAHASDVFSSSVVSSSSMSNLIEKAVAQNSAMASMVFPWERGIFKDLFRKDSLPTMATTVPLENSIGKAGPICAEDVQECVLETPHVLREHVFMRAVANVSDESVVERRNNQCELAITKWLCVLQSYLLASTTGRQIVHLGKNMVQSEAARRIVRAVIGVRSPTTAINRANCILRFYRWVADATGPSFHPLSEQLVWDYLNDLQSKQAAPSTGASLLSAFRYSKYVFGFSTLDNILSSNRIKGLTDIMFVNKRYLKQAKVLTVAQVCELHRLVKSEGLCDVDRAAVGYLLVALYGRCRHSDLACVEDIIHDLDDSGGYLEIRTSIHKTSRSVQKRTRLLPIVIPVIGVNGECWVPEVENAFERVGLKLRGHIGGPVFRPPKRDGTMCRRGLLSSECSRFLQLFLDEPASCPEGSQVMTSHALKATCLSWASKYGLDPADKAALGRHTSATSESSAVYSRDLATKAVALLQQLIHDIHHGTFLPDASRRNYFPLKKAVEVVPEPSAECNVADTASVGLLNAEAVKVEVDAVDISSEEGSSESSTTESECESSGESEDGGVVLEPQRKMPRGFRLYNSNASFMKHVVSKVVHFVDPESNSSAGLVRSFACGRRPGPNFVQAGEFDSTFMCKLCKTRALKTMNLER